MERKQNWNFEAEFKFPEYVKKSYEVNHIYT